MIEKKKKGGLSKRYQASYDSKESGAPKKSGVMNYKKCDDGIIFFNPTEGKNRINIIPYEIKTKNHPLVKKGEFEVGDKDYVMDIFVHKFVGPTEASVICLKQSYGKPCPICEQAATLRKQGKEDEAGSLKATRRVFYNVEDLKDPGKVKIFETSHYLFEKELIDEARDDEDGFIDFADPEEGSEIKFRCSKTKKNGFEFNEYKSFSFEDRDEPISDDLLESAVSFDEIMNVPTYEEVEKILFGQDDEDEDDDEQRVKKSSKKSSEDSEEDDDEEDEKPSKKSCDKNCGECPFGHKFGKDTDEFDDCDDCDVWDKCINASK